MKSRNGPILMAVGLVIATCAAVPIVGLSYTLLGLGAIVAIVGLVVWVEEA